MRWSIPFLAATVAVSGCATAPSQTLAGLNRQDPEYRTRDCRQAREAAARFDEHKDGKIAIALAGNLVAPFAGTAAAAALGARQAQQKGQINDRLRAACISDPLAKRRLARR